MSRGRNVSPLPIDADEFLEIIAATTSDVVVSIDESSTILFINSAAERVFGYAPHEVLGESLTLLMPEYLRHVHEQAMERYLETGTRHVDWTAVELPGLHRNGHEVALEVSFAESVSTGRYLFTGVIRDISQRRAMEQELRYRTLHDALTGLPNRTLLSDRLERVLRRRRGNADRDAALLFLDFDRFKLVNDSLGHAVGDGMLIEVGEVLSHAVRAEDTVARLGGDEFVILLDHVDGNDRPVELAGRIERAFREPIQVGEYQIYTSASVGIIPSLFDYVDTDSVLRDADTAMYQAKATGRGQHRMFDQSMRDAAAATMDLENDLRRAWDRNEFRVRYEPIHRIDTGDLLGFEAQVYWQHPRRGLLPPEDFEEAGLDLGIMRGVDHQAWREASRNAAAWRARYERPLWLSLNFCRQHFLSPVPDPERPLLDTLREAGSDVHQTIIELDEYALTEGTDKTLAVLQRLAELGVRVHLHRFGTDHASLYSLQRFRVDALKIDGSIVRDMLYEARNEELVTVIAGLAGNLGLEVVAQGVERQAQRAYLEALTCDYAQGPLFSSPLTPEEAARYIEAHDAPSGAAGATDE